MNGQPVQTPIELPIETRTLFTKKLIEQLNPNPKESKSREKEFSDTQVVGLKLLVNKQGRKFFYLRYTINKMKRGIKIGEFGPMTLIEARQRANELKNQINKGFDPQEEKQQQAQMPNFGEFATNHYLPYAYSNKRSANSDESKLRIHLLPLFQHRRLDQITTQELQRYHDLLKGKSCPATANRHLSLLHRIFKLAIQWQFTTFNPASNIRKHQENNERHRYLSDAEINSFIEALRTEENQVAAAGFELLLYTGMRRQEVFDGRWEHVDMIKKTWFIPKSKSGKFRSVILNPSAIRLLERQPRIPDNPYVFPGRIEGNQINNPQKAFTRVLKQAGIENFRIHDLRHSHASIAINNGATLYEVQHLLGHSQVKTTTRYAHLADETLRKVSDNIANTISNTMS
ncbi:MAG: tyrosine-type recombinase/integrase [Methylobacter sp.]|nr:tyrosine-type recombinase/integrase [Candidatus Methylobacter titanis]